MPRLVAPGLFDVFVAGILSDPKNVVIILDDPHLHDQSIPAFIRLMIMLLKKNSQVAANAKPTNLL